MIKKLKLGVIALAFALAGCLGSGEASVEDGLKKTMISLCSKYTAALNLAAAYERADKLDATTAAAIDEIEPLTTAICTSPSIPTTQQALTTVQAALLVLAIEE